MVTISLLRNKKFSSFSVQRTSFNGPNVIVWIQRKISRSEEFHWVARTSCDHYHLTWAFPPCMTISHLVWAFSPCIHFVWLHMTIPTLCRYSHLAWPFSPHIYLAWPFPSLRDHFPACVGIPTLHDHSHLVSTLHDHFPPCVDILTSHYPYATISHLVWVTILTLCPPCMTISYLVWAFSPNIHLAWPFPTLCGHSHLTWPFLPPVHLMWPFPTTQLCHFARVQGGDGHTRWLCKSI